MQVQAWAQSLVYTLEELECKICYNRYDARSRKPKVLSCLHRVCAKCLKKMVDMGESLREEEGGTEEVGEGRRRRSKMMKNRFYDSLFLLLSCHLPFV